MSHTSPQERAYRAEERAPRGSGNTAIIWLLIILVAVQFISWITLMQIDNAIPHL